MIHFEIKWFANTIQESTTKISEDSKRKMQLFDETGLGLLCSVAEQRIREEGESPLLNNIEVHKPAFSVDTDFENIMVKSIIPKQSSDPLFDKAESSKSIPVTLEEPQIDVMDVVIHDNVSKQIEHPCVLTEKHLDTEELRVLTVVDGLFYAGCLHAVKPPDVYSITLDGERKNRPHIMSKEEVLRDAIVEVSTASMKQLITGTRVCAYWSRQFRSLYPGSIAEPQSPDPLLDNKFATVEFDDGDNGQICIDDIRFLPPDYPVQAYVPDPLMNLCKRKRRTSASVEERQLPVKVKKVVPDTEPADIETSQAEIIPEDDDNEVTEEQQEHQESCESSSTMTASLSAQQLWKCHGPGYRRQGANKRCQKTFYRSIKRGNEIITVGDFAAFGRADRPFIGRVESIWQARSKVRVIVKWFYHPEDIMSDRPKLRYPGALFESPHVDENDIQTISHKCEVLSFKAYKEKLGNDPNGYAAVYENNDVYYMAGYCDSVIKVQTVQNDSSIDTKNTSVE